MSTAGRPSGRASPKSFANSLASDDGAKLPTSAM